MASEPSFYSITGLLTKTGFLLTMAASGGVGYIDRHLNDYLDLPSQAQADNEECSILGLMFELFSKTGTATWVISFPSVLAMRC